MPVNPPATHRARLALLAASAAAEGVEIIAITAGNGNGWEFPVDVLRASLPLWQGVECLLTMTGRVVRCAILPASVLIRAGRKMSRNSGSACDHWVRQALLQQTAGLEMANPAASAAY